MKIFFTQNIMNSLQTVSPATASIDATAAAVVVIICVYA